jgi:hypothetical protein
MRVHLICQLNVFLRSLAGACINSLSCDFPKNVVGKSGVRAVSVSAGVSGNRPRCRRFHSVGSEFSGIAGRENQVLGTSPYWQEAVKLELCVLRVNKMGGNHVQSQNSGSYDTTAGG